MSSTKQNTSLAQRRVVSANGLVLTDATQRTVRTTFVSVQQILKRFIRNCFSWSLSIPSLRSRESLSRLPIVERRHGFIRSLQEWLAGRRRANYVCLAPFRNRASVTWPSGQNAKYFHGTGGHQIWTAIRQRKAGNIRLRNCSPHIAQCRDLGRSGFVAAH